jgi:outer membrane protein TolC
VSSKRTFWLPVSIAFSEMSRNFIGPTLALACLAGPSTVVAAESDGAASKPWQLGPARAISLEDAVAYALTHQPSLKAALDRLKVAEADAQVPRASWLPRAAAVAEILEGTANNTTASTISTQDVALPRIGGTRIVDSGTWSPSPSTLAAISASQELFDFGRIATQSAATDANVVSERHRAEAERLAIALVVKESYFAVQSAKAVLRAAQDGYERTRVHRDMAEAGVKTGLFAPIERTRAEADLARFDVNRMRAEGGVASAQVVLAAAVGVADRMLDAAEALSPVPPVPSLEQAMTDAVARDPVLQEARARLATQQAITRAIGTEMRPDILLAGTFSGRAGGTAPNAGPSATGGGWLPDVPNWDAGLILRWPLFDGIVSARQRASSARERALLSDLEAIVQQEIAAIQRAYVRATVARASLASLARSVDAARENYAQAEARFKAGLGTALELADAEYLRTDAEIQLAGGQFELSRARAVLGKLLAEES